MAHRLIADAGSKCAVPHGHNEFVKVTLEPPRSPSASRTTPPRSRT
ncbi:MAG: 6-carboxytetrahydropterin synthase [Brevundimonas sp.]